MLKCITVTTKKKWKEHLSLRTMRIAILFSYCIKQKYSKLPIIRFVAYSQSPNCSQIHNKYEETEAHKRLKITVAYS